MKHKSNIYHHFQTMALMKMADIEWNNDNETIIEGVSESIVPAFILKINMILYRPINNSKNELRSLGYSISLLH